MTAPSEEPVRLVPYDHAWPAQFERERELLHRAIRNWLVGPIEHIGSTAIPGLIAKPVVDIMAAIESLEAARPAIAALEALSYCYAPYRADVMHWFCKPTPSARTHHLHLVPFQSPLWIERLAFRDYLRTHADSAREYAELKRQLAERYRLDRDAYTDAKRDFVDRIIKLAVERPPRRVC